MAVLRDAAAFVGLYLLADWVSYIYPWEALGITVWNPPAALTLTLLLRRGPAWAPVVFVAAAGAEFLNRVVDAPVWVDIASGLVVATGYACVAAALRRRIRIEPGTPSWRDLLQFILIVSLGVLAVGAAYVGVPVAAGLLDIAEYRDAVERFWIGETIGILATLPLLLVLTDPWLRRRLLRRMARWESFVQFSALTGTLLFVFGAGGGAELKWFYALFLPMAWISMRHGLVATALAVQWVEIGLIVAIYRLNYPASLVEDLQMLMACLALMGLILSIAVDERVRAIEDLKWSARLAAAGEMTATVLHELNQPLTALANYGEVGALLVTNGAPPDELQPVVRSMVDEVGRVSQVLTRLRDFLRSGTTRLERHSLRALVTEAVAGFESRAARAAVTLSLELADDLPEVRVDRIEIGIVLRNLVANALDAVSGTATSARRITVSVARFDPNRVCVRVTDSGPGVPAQYAARLFDPYVTSKLHGMGLGLTISRSIIETHGGRLWFENRKGASFCFTLPIAEESP